MSLQIDAGNSPAHLAAFRDSLGSLLAPGMVAITHSHWDHTYGLCAADIPAVCCENTQRHLQAMSRWHWDLPAMEQRVVSGEDILFCHEHILAEYPDPQAIRVRPCDVVFSGSLTLDLGGVHAELMHLENSHADDCTVVYIPEERVLYLGDITYEDLHHKPECYHRRRFEALLAELRLLDFDVVVPGHQPPLSREELMADLSAALSEAQQDGTLILDD
ncbi:MAG: MBL fold metallo-hydrolase [Clostridia bacterium]|nr:MBL fold metallo-hydrolase [Clostridia bacterium]